MRNMKKTIVVVITFALLLTISLPTFAISPSSTDAEKCEALGVLLGSGSGVNAQYLQTATTRAQGATLLLRLMGKEDEAQAYAGKDNFKDIVGNEWFAARLAYLKANPNLGFGGYPDGTFLPNKIMTVAEFNKVLMTCLGYKQDVDYTWNNVMNYARNLGLTSFTDGNKALINNDVAVSIIKALVIKKKGTNQTLTEYLISQGVINANVADSIGLISKTTILSAKATNDNEITVVFNKAIAIGTSVNVKSGNSNLFITQNWNNERNQLVITKVGPFLSGTYQLIVGDLPSVDVRVDAAIPESIQLTANTIIINENAPFTPVLYNQFGKDMKINARNAFVVTAFNKSTGNALMVSPNNWTINTKTAKEGETITVTVMHIASTLVGQFDIKVINQPVVASFYMTEIVPANNKSNVTTKDQSLVIKYEAYDQYRNPMVIKNKDGLIFVSSNEKIINPASITFNALGTMTVNIGDTAGQVNLTVMCNASGAVSSLPIMVYDPIGIADVRIYYPNTDIISGEATELSYNITDQFGASLAKNLSYGELNKWLRFNSLNTDIVLNNDFYVDSNGNMFVKPTGIKSGTAIVYYFWKDKLIDTLTLHINEAAMPVAVSKVDANTGLEKGAVYKLPVSAINLVDQYGRNYDPVAKGMKIEDFHIIGEGNIINYTKNPLGTIDFIGLVEGTMSFTIGINNYGKFLPNSEYAFNMKVYDVGVASNSILFGFNPIGNIYSNSLFGDDLNKAGEYAKAVTIFGKAPDGTTIALKQDKISHLTSTNPNFVTARDANGIWRIYSKSGNATDSTTVMAYDATAKKLCEMTVNSSNARSIQSVSFGPAIETTVSEINLYKSVLNFEKLKFRILDQYGVNMLTTVIPDKVLPGSTGFFTSSNSDKLSVDTNGNLVAKEAGVVTLTYTSVTGMQTSIQITIKN